MRRPVTRDLGSLTSAVAATAVDSTFIYEFDRYVTISGTFVGTIKIEVSNDGTNFVQDGADITSPKAQAVTGRAKYTRMRCSAYTSGTIVGSMYGIESIEA